MANIPVPEWVKTEWLEERRKEIAQRRSKSQSESTLLKIRREMAAYSRYFLQKNQTPKQKFVIFGQGRSGSTLLVQLLNNQPKIHCEGEILNGRSYKKVLFPNLYVQGRCTKFFGKIYGFKVKIYQLTEDQYIDPEKFILNLSSQGWKIIYLSRNNYLRSEISAMLASSKNQWHSSSKSSLKNQKITIDCNRLLKRCERRDIYRLKEEEILENLEHITVVYEEDLLLAKNHQGTSDRIFNYLGLESVSVKTKLVKITSDRLSDVIENYDELVEKVSKTKYAKFLID
ncbi:MAG: hypothetical protein WBA93_16715 [Microcoleaceae cyanobacterium]